MPTFVHLGLRARLAIALRNYDKGVVELGDAIEQRSCALADRDDASRHLRTPDATHESLRCARVQGTAVNGLEVDHPAILHVSLYSCRATSRSATGIS